MNTLKINLKNKFSSFIFENGSTLLPLVVEYYKYGHYPQSILDAFCEENNLEPSDKKRLHLKEEMEGAIDEILYYNSYLMDDEEE